ncbi:MAG TPA: sulfatase-like hydrolase/transferase [Roseiflexaceae bacterium]|nr:sulfatase-like hydrolase/transferase [Roseiflexaceae bacterium]
MDISRRNALRRIWISIFLASLTLSRAVLPQTTDQLAPVSQVRAAGRPNILVILLDDLDYRTFDNLIVAGQLPQIKANLYDQGVSFTRAYVTNSLCCPSRATLYTGQYAHNHGLWSNQGDNATERYQSAWPYYRDHLQDRAVNVALQQDGYFTAMVGKFMNGTDETTITQRPKGWDLFYYLSGGLGYAMYGYPYRKWDREGNSGTLGTAPGIYQTDQLAQESLVALQQSQAAAKPFFLVYAPTVPHVESSLPPSDDPNWPSTATPDNRLDFGTYTDTWRLPLRGRLNSYALLAPKATQPYTFTATSPSCYSSPTGQSCRPPAECNQTPSACSQPARMLRAPWQQDLGRWQVRNPATGAYDPRLDLPYADTTWNGSRVVGEDLQDPAVYKPFWLRNGFGNFHIGTSYPDAGARPSLGYRDANGVSFGDVASRDALTRQQLAREEAMVALDDALGYLFEQLRRQQLFENTVIILTSDNGVQMGEHNLGQKEYAYEESIRVPLIVRDPAHLNPDTSAPLRSDALVLNSDLAPTIAQYTIGSAAWTAGTPDGRSLLPFISTDYGAPFRRVRFLAEHKAVVQDYWIGAGSGLRGLPGPAQSDWIERSGTAASSDDIKHMPFYEVPHYNALRTVIPNSEDSLYVAYSYKRDEYPPYDGLPTTQVDLGTFPVSMTAEIEFFNLLADPYQMRPSATPPDPTYAARTQRLADCRGASACARLEDAHTPGDYDGDTRADPAAWRPADGTWQIRMSISGAAEQRQLGQPGDVPMTGDYDGDGIGDPTVWRPSSATWLIRRSMAAGAASEAQWGAPGDLPVSGDYDGDGVADLATWRPTDGTWHIRLSATAGITLEATLGVLGDRPVSGDYDGDGVSDLSTWRLSDGAWRIRLSSSRQTLETRLGAPRDLPMPGDYDGDGSTDLAVWRPSHGTWHIRRLADGEAERVTLWGAPGDLPLAADYDGDGTTDLAVWRPIDGTWHIAHSLSATIAEPQLGRAGDIPLPHLAARYTMYAPSMYGGHAP